MFFDSVLVGAPGGEVHDDTAQILEMPYKGDRLSMVVLLPKKKVKLEDVEQSLSAEKLQTWLGSLQTRGEVSVTIPKFQLTRALHLNEPLQALGMNRAFSEQEADFSGVNADRQLFVAHVAHKAFVDVNEAGTEAAAGTAVVAAEKAAGGQFFFADRPFLFLIRDTRTGAILFLGRLFDPRPNSPADSEGQ